MADIGGKSYQEWMNEIQRQGDTTKGGSVEAEQAARAAYASAANAMTPQSSNQSGFGALNFNGGVIQTPAPYNNPSDPFTTGAQSQPQPQGQINGNTKPYQVPGGAQQITGTTKPYAYNPAQDQGGGAGALASAMGGAGTINGTTGPYADNPNGQPGEVINVSPYPTTLPAAGTPGATGIINGAITPWNVTQDQTVAGNISSLTDPNSPPMQQARTRAIQQMASRGLINSSMATSAADSAMYDVANTIAQSDAATKAKAAGYNVDQLNQQVTLDKQLANQMGQAQLSADTSRYSTDSSREASRYSTDVQARTSALNNESQRMISQMNNDQQVTLQRMQQDNQTLLNTNQQAAAAFNNSMQYIDVINRDSNLDSAGKTRAIAQIYYNLQTQLRTLSQVSKVDVTRSLSLANAPGFDKDGNYVGFDESGNTIGAPPPAKPAGAAPAPEPNRPIRPINGEFEGGN